MLLNELNIGERAIVKEVSKASKMRQRFIDIGIVSGTKVECVLVSPSMDPKAYMIKGAVIAIRSEDAKFIKVEKVA